VQAGVSVPPEGMKSPRHGRLEKMTTDPGSPGHQYRFDRAPRWREIPVWPDRVGSRLGISELDGCETRFGSWRLASISRRTAVGRERKKEGDREQAKRFFYFHPTRGGSKKGQRRQTLPFQFQEILPDAPCLEGEPGRELNNPTGNRSARDPSHTWIGNTRGKRHRVEVVVG